MNLKYHQLGFVFLWITLLFYFSLTSQSQTTNVQNSFSQELKFCHYLQHQSLFDEAATALQQLAQTPNLTPQQTDSLSYSLGWAYYSQKELSLANAAWQPISLQSPLFLPAHFFRAYNLAHLEKFDSAAQLLANTPLPPVNSPDDSLLMRQLTQFQLAGFALLQRKLDSYQHHIQQYSFANTYQLAQYATQLEQCASQARAIRRKSPAIAGTLSALVPGLGKVYAGKWKQGIAAFLPVALLGAQAAENIYKRGWKSPPSLLFTGLFSIFYIGNIWGSSLTVHTQNRQLNHDLDQRILLNIHLPLRFIFDAD